MKPWCFYWKFLQISQTSPRKFFQNRFWKALRLRCKIFKLFVTIFGRYALKVNIFSVEIFQSKLLWLDENFVVLLNQKQFSIAFLLSATVTGCSIVGNQSYSWMICGRSESGIFGSFFSKYYFYHKETPSVVFMFQYIFFQEVFLTFMNHAKIVHIAFNDKVVHNCSFNTSARSVVRTLTNI